MTPRWIRTAKLIGWAVTLLAPAGVCAEESAPRIEEIVVLGAKPLPGLDLPGAKVPGTVETLSVADFERLHALSPLAAMAQRIPGADLSDVQGNGLFQDFRYRGFSASPLQGTAQAIAVYQNGVRINEAFGDTVNWDLIPDTAISRLDMWSSNPVFGLNALGGAVNITMKNGFTAQGGAAELQGGSFGRGGGSFAYGTHRDAWAFYGAAEGLRDGGWRRHSSSDTEKLYLDVGVKPSDGEFHLTLAGARSGLGAVGPTPVELSARDPRAIYTRPQRANNRMGSVAADGKLALDSQWELQGVLSLRRFKQSRSDGNAAEFETCDLRSSYPGQICLQDDGFVSPPGGVTKAFLDQFALVGPTGAPIPFASGTAYGTIDTTSTQATTLSGSSQLTSNAPVLGRVNYFTLGGSVDWSRIGFQSASSLGSLDPSLLVAAGASVPGAGTVLRARGSLGYGPVSLGARNFYVGAFLVDAIDVTPELTVTAGGRFNSARISTHDRVGSAPELNAARGYRRFNPAAGLTYKLGDSISVYGQYAEANRAPTSLELNCADPARPCLLENALVSDPPLKQVVSRTVEAGIRDNVKSGGDDPLDWKIGVYRADSHNDIIALASDIQGRGYFANVPRTRREGAEAALQYRGRQWRAFASYTYLRATYRFTGDLASPNSPAADANGNVHVTPGKSIPNFPNHQANLGVDWDVTPAWSVGGDAGLFSARYFIGDDANQDRKLGGYWVANLHGAYQLTERIQIFARINNLFDRSYATYGTYFRLGVVDGALSAPLTDSRMTTLGQPLSVYGGVKMTF